MRVECANCGWKGEDTAESFTPLADCVDLDQRLQPGSEVPAGDCPVCRAFCYILKSETPATEEVIIVEDEYGASIIPIPTAKKSNSPSEEHTPESWQRLARDCAKNTHVDYQASRRGIGLFFVDLEVLCFHNNRPYAGNPLLRDAETAAFRTWLKENDIEELAYATYPESGKDAAYTYAMLLDCKHGREEEIVTAIQSIIR